MSFQIKPNHIQAAPGISLAAALSFVLAITVVTVLAFIMLMPRHQPHHRATALEVSAERKGGGQ
jgi:multidrug efflux pump subunit AcrB